MSCYLSVLLHGCITAINQSVSQSINRSNNRSKFKQWQTTVPNKRSINESIYQPDESMTQWINKSMNQWINKSIHPSIHQSIESINESMHQCVNQWINKSMMHACLPAWLAFFFRGQSLSLSPPPSACPRVSMCVLVCFFVLCLCLALFLINRIVCEKNVVIYDIFYDTYWLL